MGPMGGWATAVKLRSAAARIKILFIRIKGLLLLSVQLTKLTIRFGISNTGASGFGISDTDKMAYFRDWSLI